MSMRNLQNTWAMSPRTDAAGLAANQLNASAQSLAVMDKNKTQTTKLRGPDTNVFGDLLPGIMGAAGAAIGAYFGGPMGAAMGGQAGSSTGAPIGRAMGGQNAYQTAESFQGGMKGMGSIFGGFMS